MNLLTKILIGAGAVTGIGYLVRLKRTSSEMETIATAKIHKLDLTALTIRVDVQIKNPTTGSLKIKYPFVKILYKDSTIGSSQSINKDIEIPPFGEAQIKAILIQIPLLSLISFGASLLKAVKDNTGVKIQLKTVSTIELGFKTIPYEKTEDITLKK
jgi:hypothetical protein